MSSPFQPSALTLVELGKDFRHLLLESIDALILVGIVLLELVGPLQLCVDDFGHLRLRQSMVVRAARAELDGHARIEAHIAIAERNAEAEQAVLIRLVERANRACIRIAVMAVAKRELRFVVRIEFLYRMQRRQGIAARRRTADVVLDEAARRLEASVQRGQVLADGIVFLDYGFKSHASNHAQNGQLS